MFTVLRCCWVLHLKIRFVILLLLLLNVLEGCYKLAAWTKKSLFVDVISFPINQYPSPLCYPHKICWNWILQCLEQALGYYWTAPSWIRAGPRGSGEYKFAMENDVAGWRAAEGMGLLVQPDSPSCLTLFSTLAARSPTPHRPCTAVPTLTERPTLPGRPGLL